MLNAPLPAIQLAYLACAGEVILSDGRLLRREEGIAKHPELRSAGAAGGLINAVVALGAPRGER